MALGRRTKRGQAIVLLAVTAAIVAFTVLTTLSIGSAVENRIRLQQTADAAAYSMAVQEARTFNYFAFSNRAIVAHYVAIMAVYGYMSYLAAYEGYLNQLCLNWGCYSSQCFTKQMEAAGVSASQISQAQNGVNNAATNSQTAGAQLKADNAQLQTDEGKLSSDSAQQSADCSADPNGSACAADNAAVDADNSAISQDNKNIKNDQNNLDNAGNSVKQNPASGGGGNSAVYASLIDNIPAELIIECAAWCVAAAVSFGALAQQCEACTQCDVQEIPYIEGTICQNIDSAVTDVDSKLGKTGGSAIADLKDFAKYHYEAAKGYTDIQSALSLSMTASMLNMPQDVAHAADPSISVPNQYVQSVANVHSYCKANTACPGSLGGAGENLLDAQWKAANATRHGTYMALGVGGSGDFLINRADGLTTATPMDAAIALAFSGGAGGLGSNFAKLRFNKITGGIGGSNASGMSELIQQTSGNVHDDVHNNSYGSYSVAGEDHGRVSSTDLACLESGSMTAAFAQPAFDNQTWAYSEPTDTGNGSSCTGQPGTSQLRWGDGSISTNQSGQNPIDLTLGDCQSSTGIASLALPTANFNIVDSSSDPLQGQPKSWVVLSRGFSSNPSDPNYQGPFTMKTQMTLWGSNADTYDNSITAGVPWNSILAYSQGLTYYHRPGDWQEPPNFYNPFWRAKLHPVMSKTDLGELIGLGTTNASSTSGLTAGAGAAALLGLPMTE